MINKIIIGFSILVFSPETVWTDVPEYNIERTAEKIVIDGILDEGDWVAAKSVGDFKFPWWKEGDKEQTEVKMLWDDTFLYVSFNCHDKYIWAEIYNTNADTYKDDCVELFWNPNPEAGFMYNMFEINCIGNLLSVSNNFQQSIYDRESRILVPHIAQSIMGTVNNDEDVDSNWTIEMAFRFSDYTELYNGSIPVDGTMWRVALNRCGGKTNRQYSQWSPAQTPKPDLHSRKGKDFGKIFFRKDPVR
ncbi:carbohydrate-binding family 9-like protein [Candidatus Latescibacterota bacterium]